MKSSYNWTLFLFPKQKQTGTHLSAFVWRSGLWIRDQTIPIWIIPSPAGSVGRPPFTSAVSCAMSFPAFAAIYHETKHLRFVCIITFYRPVVNSKFIY